MQGEVRRSVGRASSTTLRRGGRAPVTTVLPATHLRVLDELAILASEGTPGTVAALHERLGGHRNSVRAHLHALIDAGLVDRVVMERGTPGRPAHAHALTERGELAREVPRLPSPAITDDLFRAITRHLATLPTSQAHARDIGRIWAGQLLVDRPPAVDAMSEVIDVLGTSGFSPRRDADPSVVRLHGCPVYDTAREHPEIVCTMHEGMIQETFDRSEAAGRRVQLVPFAQPDFCVVKVTGDDCAEEGSGSSAT